MTVTELYRKLNERIPPSLSCSWDNDGLMCCPEPEREVGRVLIALDVTAKVADLAIREGYDVILSHHPLLFHPVKAMEPGNAVAAKTIRLLRAGVAVMSFHTRLDAVAGGVNDTLAALLGLRDVTPFGEEGIGRIGTLPQAVSLEAFANLVRKVTGAPRIVAADAGKPVLRVAVLGGSGSDDVPLAEAAGADTYLTGELAHHHLADAPEHGMNLLAAGHFHTEHPVCETLAKMVAALAKNVKITVVSSDEVKVL